MNVVANVLLQFLGILIQVGNQASGFVPEKYKGLVSGVVAAAMGVVAILAHFKNPDGTSAATEYKPE